MRSEKQKADTVVCWQNHFLFSSDHIARVLPRSPYWAALLSRVQVASEKLQLLYNSFNNELSNLDAETLASQWVRPMLAILGQNLISSDETHIKTLQPSPLDFALIAANVEGGDLSPGDLLALVRVLPWDAPLDSLSTDNDPSNCGLNPAACLIRDLKHNDLEWGLLCNGRKLRLVSTKGLRCLEHFFEIDLVTLLQQAEHDQYSYLFAFFGSDAFNPVKKKKCFLDETLRESKIADKRLLSTFQENIFQAFESLAQGFIDFPGNQFPRDDLSPVHESALITLMRLIGLLFAESQGWLPLDDPDYFEKFSLQKLKLDIYVDDDPPDVKSTRIWERLKALFDLLDGRHLQVNDLLNIDALDNHIYNEEAYPLLKEKRIGDAALSRAIDLLSCWKVRGDQKEFFNYASFRPQEISEKLACLLSYEIQIASETLARVDYLSNQSWLPAADLSEDAVVLEQRDQGRIYLLDKSGFAKTPTENSLPALLADTLTAESINTWLSEDTPAPVQDLQTASPQEQTDAAQKYVDKVLSLKLVDPACGSGQILSSAMDQLAAYLCKTPHTQSADQNRPEIQSWKKVIMQNCLYGIDKNPLAVELTRLCLWLQTGFDNPACLLEHHIRCGDAITGAHVEDLSWAPPQILQKESPGDLAHQSAGQLNAFGFMLNQSLPRAIGQAVASIQKLHSPGEEHHTRRAAFRKAEEQLQPLRWLGDLWTSVNFGNQIRPGNYDEALQLVDQSDKLVSLPVIRKAKQIAHEQSFFHWELAFPEAYYKTDGQPRNASGGFDLLLSSPEDICADNGDALESNHADPFVFFWKTALKNAHKNAIIAFMTPSEWLVSKKHSILRRSVIHKGDLQKILILPKKSINGKDKSCMVWLRKSEPKNTSILTAQITSLDKLEHYETIKYNALDISGWHNDTHIRYTLDPSLITLYGLPNAPFCQPLGEICDMAWGLRPHSRGRQLEMDYSGDMLRIYNPPSAQERHIYYPELVENKLSRYVAFPNRKSWVKYRAMYAGSIKEDFFNRPRLLISHSLSPDNKLMVATTSERMISSDAVLNILITQEGYSENYLAALLNSKLLTWLYHSQSPDDEIQGNMPVTMDQIKQLPIRITDSRTQPFERSRQGSLMRRDIEKQMDSIHSIRDMIGLDERFSGLLQAVDENLPLHTDIIHDLLNTLADSIQEQINQRSRISRNFWRDMAAAAGTELYPTLKNKSVAENSLAFHQACQPFVKTNSQRPRSLNDSLGWNEEAFLAFVIMLASSTVDLNELVGPYRIHAPAYRHRNVLVAVHDWLIDRIVYRLYGLSETEMAIIDNVNL